jgi:hypothetical protein
MRSCPAGSLLPPPALSAPPRTAQLLWRRHWRCLPALRRRWWAWACCQLVTLRQLLPQAAGSAAAGAGSAGAAAAQGREGGRGGSLCCRRLASNASTKPGSAHWCRISNTLSHASRAW